MLTQEHTIAIKPQRTLFTMLMLTSLLVISTNPAMAKQLDGQLQWSHRVELASPVRGVISEVNVTAGDKVKKGSVLLRLDPRGFKARVQMAWARKKNWSEKRAEAKRELQRAEELYDRTVLSDHDLQVAKNNYIDADAEYRTAIAEQVQAKLDLEYSEIKAPFDAVIIKRSAEPGQTVISDLKPETLLIIAESRRMLAQTFVEGDMASSLDKKANAAVIIDGKRYEAKIFSIGLEPVKAQQDKYAVSVIFETNNKTLRAGQKVQVDLP